MNDDEIRAVGKLPRGLTGNVAKDLKAEVAGERDVWLCAKEAAAAVAFLPAIEALAALEMARVSVEAEIHKLG